MDEILTLAEIEARYAPDWVLIVDAQVEEDQGVRGGRVIFHSPNGDAIYRKATELGLTQIAVRCLRPWPEDMALVLGAGEPFSSLRRAR